jgi:hypothetical protein
MMREIGLASGAVQLGNDGKERTSHGSEQTVNGIIFAKGYI